MSKRARAWIIVLALAAAGIALLFVIAQDNRPDEVLISEALDESIQASREGRPGGVLDFISNNLRVDGIGPVSKGQVARLIRENKPEVEITSRKTTVAGATAEMVADVRIKGTVQVMAFSAGFDRTFKGIRLGFAKEEARKYLIVPVRTWRLTEVNIPGDQIDFGLGM